MKLVDTSSWVHALRKRGSAPIRRRVQDLLEAGDAAWCSMVRLELWNGAGSDADRRTLRAMEKVLPELPINDAVWQFAYELAERGRKAGKTAPVQDLVICACARVHGVDLEHEDHHFDWLMTI